MAAKVLERTHLQAAFRENISLIRDDLLVAAEEFGQFAGANRRIDLLCVDRSARLVVVELKRSADGGHMDLQAIRYAAMVSTMTFDELVTHYGRLHKVDVDDARIELVEWLDASDTDEPVAPRDVGIVVVSQDFDVQVTTTALWLNEVQAMDVRCIRMSPYLLGDRLLLDVQQVIPLPEAEQFMMKLRAREAAVKAAKASGKDFTKFIVSSPGGPTPPLNKRNAALATVKAAHAGGAAMPAIAKILGRRMVVRSGVHGPDQIVDALRATNPSKGRVTFGPPCEIVRR